MHVRTPIMLGVILMLVVVLSGFCYYRLGSTPTPGTSMTHEPAAPSLARGLDAVPC
jgi:hypothetical protein